MKTKHSFAALCLVALIFLLVAWQGIWDESQNHNAQGMPILITASPPAFLPYVVKPLPSATLSPTSTPEPTCQPRPINTLIVCTRPPCPPGGHYECCYDDGCPRGCGVVCITPTNSPTYTEAPTLTVTPTKTAPSN